MGFIDVNEIQEKDAALVLEDAYQSLILMKDFVIFEKPVDEKLLISGKIMADDLKEYYEFHPEEHRYGFPYVDQKKDEEEYFLGIYPVMASVGFFWRIDVEKRIRPYGLLDTVLKIKKITRKDSDNRFEQEQVVYKEEKNFIYDYEKDVYIQINPDKRNNPNTMDYMARDTAYETLMIRLIKEDKNYREKLGLLVRRILDDEQFLTMKTQDEIKRIFEGWISDILEVKDLFLLKFLFSHTDQENYLLIEKKLGEILDILTLWTHNLSGSGKFKNTDPLYSKLIKDVNRVLDLFNPRTEKVLKGKEVSMVGFHDYDENRLYENLPQIEMERHFRTDAGSTQGYKMLYQEIHEMLLKAEINLAESEEERSIFTYDEQIEIDKLKGGAKTNFLLNLLNQKASQGVIPKDQVHYFLDKYRVK